MTIDVDGQPVIRRPREARSDGAQVEPDAPISVQDAIDDQHDPERMLADAHRALAEKERQIVAARREASNAQSVAARARDEAARAQMGRASDRASAVASAIEAAKADKAAAKIALRTAREAGDFDAEIAASEMFQSATYRETQATGELAWINQQANAAPAPQQQSDQGSAGDRMSPEARAWLDAHPRFHSDEAYRAVAEGAHTAAIRKGLVIGSQDYVNEIDRIVTSVYGAEHGTSDEPPLPRRQQTMTDPNVNRRQDHGSTAGASNRGGGGSQSGARTVETLFGPVGVTRQGGRIVQVVLPPPGTEKRADWEEAATIAGMKLGEYAYEQVKIAEDRQSGGNGGWVQGDGTTAQ